MIKRQESCLALLTSHKIEDWDGIQRVLNPVGGFEVIPARIFFEVGEEFFIQLQISDIL